MMRPSVHLLLARLS